MKNCNIAILGATGAVGREMLNVLEEYDIPVSRLKLLSSARSAGRKIPSAGKTSPWKKRRTPRSRAWTLSSAR